VEDHDIDAGPLGRARGGRDDAVSPYIAARAASAGSRVVAAIVSAHDARASELRDSVTTSVRRAFSRGRRVSLFDSRIFI